MNILIDFFHCHDERYYATSSNYVKYFIVSNQIRLSSLRMERKCTILKWIVVVDFIFYPIKSNTFLWNQKGNVQL